MSAHCKGLKIALPSVAMLVTVEYVKARSRRSHRGLYSAKVAKPLRSRWERVAQLVEHVTFNHGVMGSSPIALTILDNPDASYLPTASEMHIQRS